MRFAVDPGIQPADNDALRRKLASATNFQAFHMFRGESLMGALYEPSRLH